MENKQRRQSSLFVETCDPDRKDERRLLELFRLMPDSDRNALLHELSMSTLIELSKSAVPSSEFPVMLPRDEDEADPVGFVEEFLTDIKPDQEPAHYLGDELISALNDAWNGRFAYDILGSAKYDEWRAADLLGTLQAYAENSASPAPAFGEEEMKEFIVDWRSNFMGALERLKLSSEDGRHSGEIWAHPSIDNQRAGSEDEGEKLIERLVALMPCDTMVTDLWNWDIRFEDSSFDDIVEAAFADEGDLAWYADALAEDFQRWIDEYGMDYNQQSWGSDEEFSDWIGEQCLEFMRKWRANVRKEFGR
jgi:hypothetical protein